MRVDGLRFGLFERKCHMYLASKLMEYLIEMFGTSDEGAPSTPYVPHLIVSRLVCLIINRLVCV